MTRQPFETIIVDVRHGGYRVATYLVGGRPPTSVGTASDPANALIMVATALGMSADDLRRAARERDGGAEEPAT